MLEEGEEVAELRRAARHADVVGRVEEGEDLYRLVRNVLVHEVAHHFGFSDADIAALEQQMD